MSANYSTEVTPDLYWDLTAKVKLPTASAADRLGTGKADFTIATELTKVFGDLSVYGGVRYKSVGKTSLYQLRNTSGGSIGVGYDLGARTSLTVDYDIQQSAYVGGIDSKTLTAALTFKVADGVRLQVYASHGFETFAADQAGGVQFIYRFK